MPSHFSRRMPGGAIRAKIHHLCQPKREFWTGVAASVVARVASGRRKRATRPRRSRRTQGTDRGGLFSATSPSSRSSPSRSSRESELKVWRPRRAPAWLVCEGTGMRMTLCSVDACASRSLALPPSTLASYSAFCRRARKGLANRRGDARQASQGGVGVGGQDGHGSFEGGSLGGGWLR